MNDSLTCVQDAILYRLENITLIEKYFDEGFKCLN